MKEKLATIIKSKLVIGILAGIIILFAIFFPHTVKTKAISELAGNYTVSYERYVLHQMVETKTENVCLPGTVIRTRIVKYGLDGEINSIHIENCDATQKTVTYQKGGLLKEITQITFVGDAIRTNVMEYNKNGLPVLTTTSLSGTVTTVEGEYDEDHMMIKQTTKVTFIGEVILETVETYKDGDIEEIEYSNPVTGEEITLTCLPNGNCDIDSFSSPDYDVSMNTTSGFYEVDANSKTQQIAYTQITTWNYMAFLTDAASAAEVLNN